MEQIMSEPKSKLPDFKEVSTMVSKFFQDVKTSLGEIIVEYRKNRKDHPASKSTAHKSTAHKPADKSHNSKPTAKEKVEKPVRAPKPNKPKAEPKKSDK